MRYFAFIASTLLLSGVTGRPAAAQAAAEYGLGAGRAATMSAPARTLGTSLSDLFGAATKAAQGEPAAAEPASPASGAAPKPNRPVRSKRPVAATRKKAAKPPTSATEEAKQLAAPTRLYEDPKQIQAGIQYDEMVRRFGPPSMSMATGPGRSTLLYSSGETNYQVEVEDGKVIAPRRIAPQ